MKPGSARVSRFAWSAWPFAAKLGLLLAALVIAPLVLVTFYNARAARTELLSAAHAQNAVRASATAQMLDQRMGEMADDIRLLGELPSVVYLLLNPEDPRLRNDARRVLSSERTVHHYDALYVTDRSGKVLVSADERFLDRSYLAAPWFRTAIAGQTTFDEPRYDPQDDQVFLHFSAASRSPDGAILGTVIGRITMSALDQLLDLDSNYAGRGEFGMLWDDVGLLLYDGHQSGRRFIPLAPVSGDVAGALVAEARFGPTTAELLRRAHGHTELLNRSQLLFYDRSASPYEDFTYDTSGAVYGALAPLQDKRWMYGVFTPQAGVLTRLDEQTARWYAAALIAALLAILAGTAGTRWISRPLGTVVAVAQAITTGDLSRRVGLPQRDEVGRLASAFDAMADSLVTQQTELRHARDDLEQRVQERTAALSQANVALQAEIVERTRAEEAAAAGQRLLRDITDNSTALIYALDVEGRFLLINRQLEAVLGAPRAMLLGKTREATLPAAVAKAQHANDLHVMHTQQPSTFEETSEEPDGERTYLSVKVPLFDPQGVVYGIAAVSTDITERKLTETQLNAQLVELRRWHEATLGREMRIIELKAEVNGLASQMGLPQRYASAAQMPQTQTDEPARGEAD